MPIVRKANYVLLFGVVNLFTYFLIQDCVTHKYNFLTDLDKSIPFIPEFVWIYHSLVPVIGVTMVLLARTKKLFFNALWACVATTLTLYFFYVMFPSFYPRPTLLPETLSEAMVQLSYDIDNSSNTFPSGHVAFAWIMFWVARHSERARATPILVKFYMLWAVGITISTLAIKMHYIIDIFGGFVVASSSFFIIRELIKKRSWYQARVE
mgnify:CR=1 FL=1